MREALAELPQRTGAQAVIALRLGDVPRTLVSVPQELTSITWPLQPPAADSVITDPGIVSATIPTQARLRIGPVGAMLTRRVGASVAVLAVWRDPPAPEQIAVLDQALAGGLDVQLVEAAGQAALADERAALASVLGALDSAVIAIRPERDEVQFNAAAAELLDLPAHATAADVAASMLRLQRRALNPEDVARVVRNVYGQTGESAVWRFSESPTHVKVTSRAITDGSDAGRVWVLMDVSTEYALVEKEQQARLALRITTDAMLDPQALLWPVRDSSGVIVDFVYREVNEATCQYLGMTRAELIGISVEATLPQVRQSGLFEAYVRVVTTGHPLVLDAFPFYNDVLVDQRYYDIRGAKAGDGMTLTWRDVTQRSEAARLLHESEGRLAATLDSMLSPHLMLAAVRGAQGELVDCEIRTANMAAANYLGVPADQLIGLRISQRLGAEQFEQIRQWCAEVLDGSGRVELDDAPIASPQLPETRYLDVKAVGIGQEVSFTFQDVTERHGMIEQIAESEEHYRLLAQNSSDVVVLIREHGVRWVSPALQSALGWQPKAWEGRHFVELAMVKDRPQLAAHLARVSAGETEVVTVRMLDAEQTSHWVELHSSPYLDSHGRQTAIVTSFRVVDDEVAADAERERQARSDSLTGLANRRAAMSFLKASMARALSERSRVGVLFCDLDLFKTVNDTYGHTAGDEVLKVVGARLRSAVRSMDVVARMGGDELVVILPGIPDQQRLLTVAQQIHRQVSQPVRFSGDTIPVTVSMGAALAQPLEQPEHLVARADAAMYEAKRTGRNRVVLIE